MAGCPSLLRLLATLPVLLVLSNAYKFFQNAIPNGDKVLNPCDNTIWVGVGHINKDGGGDRNVFGKAFEAAGKTWSTKLCREDSDGDGKTNGEELGDPECNWKPGNPLTPSQNVTHPGVCEPLDSPQCQGQVIKCPDQWSCPAINEPDVTRLRITIPRRVVPAQKTTYLCYNKKVPADVLYNIVASKSVIDNTNVMHHMTVYGCNGDLDDKKDGTVDACQLRDDRCKKMVHIWAIGMQDFCQDDYKAFRFGKGMTTWFSIQYHWNNPQIRADYTDASGVEIFYTPKLRKYAEDMFQTGEGALFIPPNSKDYKVTGLCSHECSQKAIEKPINLTSIVLHMHGTGRRMWAEQYRDGKLLRKLAEDNPFHYSKPVLHKFEVPIEFRPGDELKIECTFNTVGNNDWVLFGPGTTDEMCVTLISYYPANEFRVDECFSVNGRCAHELNDVAPGCDFVSLIHFVLYYKDDIFKYCDVTNGRTCPRQCQALTGMVFYQYPNCFRNQPSDVSRFIWSRILNSQLSPPYDKQLVNAFQGCDLYMTKSEKDKGYLLPAM